MAKFLATNNYRWYFFRHKIYPFFGERRIFPPKCVRPAETRSHSLFWDFRVFVLRRACLHQVRAVTTRIRQLYEN